MAAEAGHTVVVAGRNRARLEKLATDVNASDVRIFDLTSEESMRAALVGTDVVVSCVGPFTRFGLPVARAAIATGTPYVDTCGEPRFCEELLVESATAESPLITAIGGASLLADLATATALRHIPDPRRVTLAYRIAAMRPSRGTLGSEVAMIADGAVVIRGRELTRLPAGGIPAGLPDGRGVRFPVPDAVVISRYCTPNECDAYLVSSYPWIVGPSIRAAAIACSAPGARRLLEALASRSPSMDDGRPHGRFTVLADVDGQTVSATADDVYGFTANAAIHVAEACARTRTTGLRAASQIVDDIDSTARHLGVRIDVETSSRQIQ